jgi:hypothetical protein
MSVTSTKAKFYVRWYTSASYSADTGMSDDVMKECVKEVVVAYLKVLFRHLTATSMEKRQKKLYSG